MENKRWIYAVTGTVILLFAGLVYAWSVIASPLIAYFTEWNKAQISLTFTICMSGRVNRRHIIKKNQHQDQPLDKWNIVSGRILLGIQDQ